LDASGGVKAYQGHPYQGQGSVFFDLKVREAHRMFFRDMKNNADL
jgi:hypothetical protein